LSSTNQKIEKSISVSFADSVRDLERNGEIILKLQTGEPYFKTHKNIIKSAYNALNKGYTKYSDSRGLISLRREISKKLLIKNKIKANPLTNILITNGAVHGISIAIKAIVKKGDEVVILEPYWKAYESCVLLSGGVPKILNTKEDNFNLNTNLIESALTSKTKLVIINSPNNPSGSIYNKEQLNLLAKKLFDKKIYMICDEVYEDIILENELHFSPGSLSKFSEYIISVYSFSKSFAMTGWRIGYLVANEIIIDKCLMLSQFSITNVPPFTQKAAEEALINEEVKQNTSFMLNEYKNRLVIIKNIIKDTWLEKATTLPKGTFYVLIDISDFNNTSFEFANSFLEKHKIAITPGLAFGKNMDKYVRICFSEQPENIKKCFEFLRDFND
jgi:aspartate/methionine/tyrosine aminotransferase